MPAQSCYDELPDAEKRVITDKGSSGSSGATVAGNASTPPSPRQDDQAAAAEAKAELEMQLEPAPAALAAAAQRDMLLGPHQRATRLKTGSGARMDFARLGEQLHAPEKVLAKAYDGKVRIITLLGFVSLSYTALETE